MKDIENQVDEPVKNRWEKACTHNTTFRAKEFYLACALLQLVFMALLTTLMWKDGAIVTFIYFTLSCPIILCVGVFGILFEVEIFYYIFGIYNLSNLVYFGLLILYYIGLVGNRDQIYPTILQYIGTSNVFYFLNKSAVVGTAPISLWMVMIERILSVAIICLNGVGISLVMVVPLRCGKTTGRKSERTQEAGMNETNDTLEHPQVVSPLNQWPPSSSQKKSFYQDHKKPLSKDFTNAPKPLPKKKMYVYSADEDEPISDPSSNTQFGAGGDNDLNSSMVNDDYVPLSLDLSHGSLFHQQQQQPGKSYSETPSVSLHFSPIYYESDLADDKKKSSSHDHLYQNRNGSYSNIELSSDQFQYVREELYS